MDGKSIVRLALVLVVSACAAAAIASAAWAGAVDDVPEAINYIPVYKLALPGGAHAWNSNAIPYSVDNRSLIHGPYGRIGYYMELKTASGPRQFAWASMDQFTLDAGKIGVPSRGPNGSFPGDAAGKWQQTVSNMNVASNVAGVVTGKGIATGNLEFWSTNYGGADGGIVPGGTNSFDFDDTKNSGSDYGSMQVHNYGAGQTIMAYNRWGSSTGELGIGNQPATSNTDWTFANNAGSYTTKNLEVYVRPSVFDTVPEAKDYTLVYALDVPRSANTDLNSTGAPYLVDNSSVIESPFNRIAYYLELKTPTGTTEWVYASMDAFTDDLTQIGVPTDASGGPIWDQAVTNMNVFSNVLASSLTGTGLAGSLEFWPDNYGTGANGVYDYDDSRSPTTGGYGSMQVHLPGAGETLLAYNAWGSSSRIGDLGIGNQGSGHPDWTFSNNAGQFEVANLYVLVHEVPEPATLVLVTLALGGLGLLAPRRRRRRAR